MAHQVATIDSLSKKFCRRLKRSLWYGVKDLTCELLARPRNTSQLRKHEFWALDDLNFNLHPGEISSLELIVQGDIPATRIDW